MPDNNKHIPWDLIEEILLLSPVKSLARFKCVSQRWNSHISSPEFIQRYNNNDSKSKRRVYPIFRRYSFDRRECLYFGWRGRDRSLELRPPPARKYRYILRPIGTSNGIVCYVQQNCCQSMLLLWAPSLEEYLDVEAPSLEYKLHCYAIGHHPDTCDLNIVQLSSRGGDYLVCKLYSHQARKWSVVSAGPHLGLRRVVEIGWESQSHSGRFHWLVLGEDFRAVLWFDMRSKALGLMDLPESLRAEVRGGDRRVELSKFGNYEGKLTVLVYVEHPWTRGSRHSCTVWVLEEYGSPSSWRELGFEIELEEKFRVVGFLDNFTMLLFVKNGSKVRYDVRTKQMMHFEDVDCFAGAYEETFFHLTNDQEESSSNSRRRIGN